MKKNDLLKCGFTDVVKVNRIYQCSKCGKIMPEQWAAEVIHSKLKLPKETNSMGKFAKSKYE